MKPVRCLLFIGAVFAAVQSMMAQTELDPVTVPVEVVAECETESGVDEYNPASFWLSLAGILNIGSGQIEWEGGHSFSGTANLKPGKSYQFYVSNYLIVDYKLRFFPPAGYSIFVENVERQRFDSSGDRYVKVRAMAETASPAGEAAAPRPGRILWSAGMGRLKNGDAAGDIHLRENNLSSSTFTPSALYFDHDNPDVRVVSPGGVLRQVYANECLADILADDNHTFWIRFYGRNAIGAQNPDGTWQVGGTPFVAYKLENPVYPTVDRLKITRTWAVSGSRTMWTQIQKSGSSWTVMPWTAASYPNITESQTTVAYADADRDETISVKTPSGSVVAQTFNEYTDYTWGRELYRTVLGHGQSNPLQTTFDYHTTTGSGALANRIKWRIAPDGNWERYDYYSDLDRKGQLLRTYRPFGDTTAVPSSASTTSGEVTDFDYAADFTGMKTLPSSIITKRNNVVSGQSIIAYDDTSETRNGLPIVVATRDDYWASGSKLTTITRTYRADAINFSGTVANAAFYAGKPHSVIRSDNTMQAHVYLWGQYNPSNRTFTAYSGGTEFMIIVIEGTISSTGNTPQPNFGYTGQTYAIGAGFYLIPNKSTWAAAVYSASGTPIWTENRVYASGSWTTVAREVTTYTQGLAAFPSWKSADSGDPYVNMETFSASYSSGHLPTWSKDASGIETTRQYDDLNRVYSEKVSAATGQPYSGDRWSLTGYDAASRVTKVWTSNAFNHPNPASTDIVTTTNYDWAGRVTSVIVPAVVGETVTTATTSTTHFYGGNPRRTRVVRPDGPDIITETWLDGRTKSVTGSGTAPRHSRVVVVADGRLVTEEGFTPSYGTGDGWKQTWMDWLGRVSEELRPTPDGYHTKDYREYNSLGQLVRRHLHDHNWSSLLAPTRYIYDANGRLTRSGMDVNEAGGLSDTGVDRTTIRSETFEYLESAWWSTVTTKALTNTANATDGVQNIQRTRLTGLYTNIPGGKFTGETRTIDANNQTTTVKTAVDRTARAVTTTTTVPGSTTAAVSLSVNGLQKSNSSSTGVLVTQTYDGQGRPLRTTTRDDVYEELEYYPGTTLVKHRKNAYLGGAGFQQTCYDNMGRVTVDRIYDSAQWKTSRYSYTTRGEVHRQWGSGQNPVEYVYNPYGWRTEMRLYQGTGVNWDSASWPGAGQTADTTKWVQQPSTGLVTSKESPGGATVSFTYNKRSQTATRTWARGVGATYYYEDSAGYRTGELKKTDYGDSTPDVDFYYTRFNGTATRTGKLMRVYDGRWREFFYRLGDDQLRAERLDWDLYGVGANGGREVHRSYDALGRPAGVHAGWEDSTQSGNPPATLEQESVYTYASDTGLISRIRGHRPWVVGADFDFQYHPGSDLVSSVIGGWYAAGYRRDNYYQSWREAVDVVETKWSGSTRGKFTYDYDWVLQPSGRRIESGLAAMLGYGSGLRDEYLYTTRGEMDWTVARDLSNSATIPNRYRDWSFDSLGNRTNEAFTGGSRVFTPNNKNQYSAIAGVTHSYDADGNLTSDGVWNHSWDGENRLKSASRVDLTQFLEFTYDYLGRRVSKVVRNAAFTMVSSRRYIYDGWNVVVELDAISNDPYNFPVARTFTWGLDNTGTVHGGGGVGGLLLISDGSSYFTPIYDANGNVHGLLDNSGNVAAAYGYSASGEIVQSSGWYAAASPFRFASKWYDSETGLYQYNHRYYSPSQGRFISRDPIAENGGLNLYAYCGNDPVGKWDYLGTCFDIEFGGGYYDDEYGYGFGFDFGSGNCWDEDWVWGGGGGYYVPDPSTGQHEGTWRAFNRYSNVRSHLGQPRRGIHSPLALSHSEAANSVVLAEQSTSGTSGAPVFNEADVAAVLNRTPAGQALLARLKKDFDVYLGDVHGAVKDPATGKMVAGPVNPNLQGGYAKGTGGTSGTKGVIILNRQSGSKGTFKGTDAEFWAYVLVQEVNEHDLHWGGVTGTNKQVEVTNRVQTE
ncbi:MAG: RHS repeat-associated core domain-containing protein, partial [Opitutaceae bacterium]